MQAIESPQPVLANTLSTKGIANGVIALAVFLGGFVFFEPAPYELFLAATLVIWVVLGLRIPRGILPVLILFTLFNVGGVLSSLQIADYKTGFIYVAVSYFLALTSVFFAIVIAGDHNRLKLMFKVYVVSAILSSILGILGYFGVAGFQQFTLYNRSAGGFQDPNVYGPFLIAPILYLIYRLTNLGLRQVALAAGILLVLLLGLFLAFSRAAWGLAVVSVIIFYALLFINEQNAKIRLKYIVLAVAGFLALVVALLGALQIDAISSLFEERARVVQSYDGGRMGRFERHWIGFELALSKPFGIGPREFPKFYIEDTHNILLKALMAYGWLGFVTWLALMIWTVVAGFKLLFRPRPWQVYAQIAYTVFIGHLLLGWVIDTDHWRHFYLMIGIIWGCVLLESKWQKENGAQPIPTLANVPNAETPVESEIGGNANKHPAALSDLFNRLQSAFPAAPKLALPKQVTPRPVSDPSPLNALAKPGRILANRNTNKVASETVLSAKVASPPIGIKNVLDQPTSTANTAQASKTQSGVAATSSTSAWHVLLLQKFAVALIIFLGGFVLIEPAPYEILLLGVLFIWLCAGLRVPNGIVPLLILFTILCAGGIVSSFQSSEADVGFLYTTVTYYLAISAIFFAIVIGKNSDFLPVIFMAYVPAAAITSIFGLAGYAGISGFESFTHSLRASGVFQDANVFAPFLTMPILYLFYCLLSKPIKYAPMNAMFLVIILLGLLFAFSRGAWGTTFVALALFYALLFVNEQSPKIRFRYLLVAASGVFLLVVGMLAILQLGNTAEFFAERAQVVQKYDGGEMGRFARHAIGFQLSLSHPLGIGPLEFGKFYDADTHNNFLKALMAYGWIGFICWVLITGWTLVAGFPLLFKQRVWQVYLQIAYTTFLGHMFLGWVIDTDHWRHFYLLIGIIWGCILLERNYQRQSRESYKAATPEISPSVQALATNSTARRSARPSVQTGKHTTNRAGSSISHSVPKDPPNQSSPKLAPMPVRHARPPRNGS